MEIATASATPEVLTKSEVSRSKLAADLDSFLLLLTTQLKNQDPLSPLEPTEFTAQLVSFAAVEQQIATNTNLEDLLKIQNASFAASLVSFIGTEVEMESNQLPLQSSKAEMTYTMSENAKFATLSITDSNGDVVRVEKLDNTAGDHVFEWDGTDQNGIVKPDGPYKVSITALGVEDQSIEASIKVKGRVTGVSMSDGTVLDVGGVPVGLEDVLSINEVPK